jgi:capsule polysaccharide modification protein KpsS
MPIKELTLEELEAELQERYSQRDLEEAKASGNLLEDNGPVYEDTAVPKQTEIILREAEVIRLNPAPGEALFFKFKGDDFYNDDVQRLGDRLRAMFKNNKVIVMTLPKDHDVELTTISENVTTEEEVKDCSIPTSYCNDCHCGKKEAIEGKK